MRTGLIIFVVSAALTCAAPACAPPVITTLALPDASVVAGLAPSETSDSPAASVKATAAPGSGCPFSSSTRNVAVDEPCSPEAASAADETST